MSEPQFSVAKPGSNPGIQQYMSGRIDGKSQAALALKRVAMLQSLEATGTAKPASILNFNPLPLRVEGGIRGKIPSVLDPSVSDDHRVTVQYKGKPYRASIVTLRSPIVYPIITDVSKADGQDMADGIGQYDIRVCKQIEIAHCYWTAYNTGGSDSSGMGGVVIFEGDRHSFRDASKSGQLLVPEFISLPTRTREYFSRPQSLEKVLTESLNRQRDYYDNQMQIAQGMHEGGDEQRKSITKPHRIWAQFGLDMGWSQSPQAWMLAQNDPEVTCDGCGAGKKRATAWFCHACARPYDPFAAYMAGEVGIDSVHLNRVSEDKWPAIRKEEAARRKRRGLDPGPTAKE